jgi:hypothetical protein
VILDPAVMEEAMKAPLPNAVSRRIAEMSKDMNVMLIKICTLLTNSVWS